MDLYTKRKAYMVKDMRATLLRLSNKAKYILETLDDLVDLRRKTTEQVNALLESRGYDRIDGDYKYLVKMPMDSVCQENVDAALKEKAETETALEILQATTCEQMWIKELDTFEQEYRKYKDARNRIQSGEQKPKKDAPKIKRPIVRKST
jgi:hypothetical protein